jgi:MFS family permease
LYNTIVDFFYQCFSGFILDRFGRRKTIVVNAAIFVAGGLGIALCRSVIGLVSDRFLAIIHNHIYMYLNI